jgi:uncharacterized protein
MRIKIVFILLLICQFAWGLDVPRLKGRVNDYTESTLTAQEVRNLEAKLKAFEDSTSNQIVVLIMSSLDGEDLEDFSMEVAESWKIGQKGKDNGVILLFFMEDHKDRIEVGYGLEAVLPDIVAGWILDKEVAPRFKVEQYYEGIDVAIDKIILSTTGEYQKEIAPAMEQERKMNNALIGFLVLAVLAGLIGYLHWIISGIGAAIGTPIIWAIIFGPLSLGAAIILIVVGFLGGIIAHGIMSIGLGGGVTGTDFGSGVVFASGGRWRWRWIFWRWRQLSVEVALAEAGN